MVCKTTLAYLKNGFMKMLLNGGTITIRKLCSGGVFRIITKVPVMCITRKQWRRRFTMKGLFKLSMMKKLRLKHMHSLIKNRQNYEHIGMQKGERNQANRRCGKLIGRAINKKEIESIREELIILDTLTNALFRFLFPFIMKSIFRYMSWMNLIATFSDFCSSKMALHLTPLNG